MHFLPVDSREMFRWEVLRQVPLSCSKFVQATNLLAWHNTNVLSYSSRDQKSERVLEGSHQGVGWAVFLLGSKGECVLALSSFQRHLQALAYGPRAATVSLWSLLLRFRVSCLPLWLKKDPCDSTGPSRIIQDKLSHLRILNLMTSAKAPSPCKVPYSLVLGIRHGWGAGGGSACLSTTVFWEFGDGQIRVESGCLPEDTHYQTLQTIFVVSAHSACYLFPLLHFPVNDSLLFHLSLSLEIT